MFYEKNFEQVEKYNIPYEEMEDWNRYEINIKQRATAFILLFVN
ncbi:replication initiation factor domain-containing protein [Bacillus sp. SL00103]